MIVLDIRQYAVVLCLADDVPDRSASPPEFFTEDKRRTARQTRQAGCRPPTRITTLAVVLPREKPCIPLSTDAIYGKAPNADAIRLLMGSQFWYFRQLLDQHMEEGRMLTCLQAVLDFTNAGWRQLCDTLQ